MAAEVFSKAHPPAAASEYLDAAQVCAIFRIKDRTLRRRVASGAFVPHIMSGRRRLWRAAAVEAYFAAHESPSGQRAPRRRRRTRNG
jgi:helix-turn-helix protein